MTTRVAVEVIIGTEFMNRHVENILRTEQGVLLHDGEFHIVKQFYRRDVKEEYRFAAESWSDTATCEVRGGEDEDVQRERK